MPSSEVNAPRLGGGGGRGEMEGWKLMDLRRGFGVMLMDGDD